MIPDRNDIALAIVATAHRNDIALAIVATAHRNDLALAIATAQATRVANRKRVWRRINYLYQYYHDQCWG